MRTRKTTTYIAFDGKEFASRQECERYETQTMSQHFANKVTFYTNDGLKLLQSNPYALAFGPEEIAFIQFDESLSLQDIKSYFSLNDVSNVYCDGHIYGYFNCEWLSLPAIIDALFCEAQTLHSDMIEILLAAIKKENERVI